MSGGIDVLRSSLVPLDLPAVGDGGQCEDVSWVCTPDGRRWLFKAYLDDAVRPDTHHRLRELVAWRERLDHAGRRWLDDRAAWVRHTVVDRDRLAGVLVPPAPPPYWTWAEDASGVPRSSTQLGVPHSRAVSLGQEYYSVPRTIALLGDLLTTLLFLHERGITVGDLQRGNILVPPPNGAPTVHLVDCDSVLLDGRWTLAHAESEMMRPTLDECPGWPTTLSPRTDLYKFALLAVGFIEKKLDLIDVPAEMAVQLPARHVSMLRRMLHDDEELPAPAHLRTVGRFWTTWVDPADGDRFYGPDSLNPVPWMGIPSRPHDQGVPGLLNGLPRTSPTQVAPLPTTRGAIPRRADTVTGPVPGATSAHPAGAPRHGSWPIGSALGLLVAAAILVLVYTQTTWLTELWIVLGELADG